MMQDTTATSPNTNGETADDRKCFIERVRGACHDWIVKHASLLKILVLSLLSVVYVSYYVMALMYSADDATALTVFTSIALFVIIWKGLAKCSVVVSFVTSFIVRPTKQFIKKHRRFLKWFVAQCLLFSVVHVSLMRVSKTKIKTIRCCNTKTSSSSTK